MFFVAFVLLVLRLRFTNSETTDKIVVVGSSFSIVTLPLSFSQVLFHLLYFVRPGEQAQIVRIVCMVPVYSLASLLSLKFPKSHIYIQVVREVYEGYVIYSFVNYLINYLGGDAVLAPLLAVKSTIIGQHKPPFCCLKPWPMGQEFLTNCKLGVFQYLLSTLLSAFLTVVLEELGVFAEGQLTPLRGYFWVTLLNSVSQSYALYSMIIFYHATHKDLAEVSPFLKFLCIKSVVFATWWQGLGVNIIMRRGFLSTMDIASLEEISKVIQALLLCLEMWVASVAFFQAFPVSEYYPRDTLLAVSFLDSTREKNPLPRPFIEAVWLSFFPHEFLVDVCNLARYVSSFSIKCLVVKGAEMTIMKGLVQQSAKKRRTYSIV